MNSKSFIGGTVTALTLTAFLFIAALLPLQALSAAESNNPPQITSEPGTFISAGQTYTYEIIATDKDGDTLAFSTTAKPNGMGLDENTLQWQPTVVGTFNVIVEVNDGNEGFDSQAWQITVAPGAVASVTISPNDRPTIVTIGQTQQFTAIAYDTYGNELTDATVTWSTDESYGNIDENGLFTPSHGGIGFAAAAIGDVSASNGLVVKDNRIEHVDPIVVEPEAPTEDTTEVEEETTDTNTNETAQAEEDVETEQNTEESALVSVDSESDGSENKEEDEECTNWPHWLIWLMLVGYTAILVGYFLYEKKRPTSVWWIFPLLLTTIGLISFYKYVCPETYLWWPWLFVVIGIFTTLFLKGKSKKDPDDSQTELPF